MILELLQAATPVQLPRYETFQDWLQDTSYIEMIFKGLIIGIIVSAPMGPVGVLCIQRTLNKGRWEGFATGVGAALSDLIYAIIIGFALNRLLGFIKDPAIAWWLQIASSALFLLFGIYTFISKPKNEVKVIKRNKGTLFQNFVTGFIITISNPLIVGVFVPLFTMFSFIIVGNFIAQMVGYLFLIIGALGWWFGLTWLIDKIRNKYNIRIVWYIHRAIGVMLIITGIIMVINILTGNSINLDEFKYPFHIQ